MSIFYPTGDLGRARTVIVVAGVALLSVALWFPRTSILYGAGVLISFAILVGVKNSKSTMSTAWLSILTTACCVTGAFLTSASATLSLILSLLGVALAIYLAAWHLNFLLKKRQTD